MTGLLAGVFGVGGGAVIVPVLFEVFRLAGVPDAVRMQLCIGTSLAVIVPTTLRSYFSHRAKGLLIEGGAVNNRGTVHLFQRQAPQREYHRRFHWPLG